MRKNLKNHPARLQGRLETAIDKEINHPHHNGWWHVSCSHWEYDTGSQIVDMIYEITGTSLQDTRMSQTIGQMLVSMALDGHLKKADDGVFYHESGFSLFIFGIGAVMEYRGSLYTLSEVARVSSRSNIVCCDYSHEEYTPSPWEVKIPWSPWQKPGPRPTRTPRA